MTDREYAASGARFLKQKHRLTRAEAERLASREDTAEIQEAHEAWRQANGMPAHGSPLALGDLKRRIGL